MNILIDNAFWMTGNILLGIIAVVLGLLALKTKNLLQKGILLFLWLLFIPNTSYMLTDIIHIPKQLHVLEGIYRTILILQYTLVMIVAIATFILALYPFEKILQKELKQKKTGIIQIILFFTNFVIAFGIVLGRIQRTNSWELFTNIGKVIQDGINVLTTKELLLLVVFFGILNNFIYFSLRGKIKKIIK